MPRRLILLLDGTWNDADQGTTDTNVVRLRELLAECLDGAQTSSAAVASPAKPAATSVSFRQFTFNGTATEYLIFYERGVGTGGFFDLYRGGAFGAGLSRNVRRAYKFLSKNYEPNDEIFIFGFSRGSYTARSLVGYISAVGLIKRDCLSPEMESKAWYFYRTSPADRLAVTAEQIRRHAHDKSSVRINLLAVFDTVGALGIPIGAFWRENRDLFEFHDVGLSGIVDNCLHAVAIDEHRESFQATLWRIPKFEVLSYSAEQVWFTGAHSDIGGGYIEASTRSAGFIRPLDDITLDWMLKRVRSKYDDFPITRQGKPAWRETDARWLSADHHEARSSFYKLTPTAWRSIGNRSTADRKWPREIDVCLDRHSEAAGEGVHLSAVERIGTQVTSNGKPRFYAPRNLIRALGLDSPFPTIPAHLKLIDWSGDALSEDEAKRVSSEARLRLKSANIL